MSDKPNNPQDHEHSDYATAWVLATVAMVAAVFTFICLIFVGPSPEDIDHLNQRVDELECRLADNETECLKGILEETR